MNRHAISHLILLALPLLLPAAVSGQIPAVGSVSSAAVARGQTVEVTVAGASLAKVDGIGMAEGRGLEVSIVAQAQPKDDQLKLRLTATADAAPGERELRLVSAAGVSAPLRVSVEQLPALVETEINNTYEQSQSVATPCVVSGAISPAGDADVFRVNTVKGQTLIVNVLAARIRSALDPTVVLYDPAGKEVAANNDTNGPDSFLAYEVPADGSYTVELRDLQYRGGDNFNYRLELGAIPYLTAIEPMAGRKGQLIDLQFKGFNLAGADKRRIDLTYAAAGRIGLRAQTALGLFSNELPFEVTELAPTVERESNDTALTATPIASLEADVTGIVDRPGDVDFYKLTVARRTTLNMEVLSRRLASPLDALLTLHNAKGDPIDRNDDAAGADARISRALDPGDYFLSVRDLAYGGGPTFTYRLAIRPVAATMPPTGSQDFALRFLPDTARLYRGGATKLWCDVVRTGGFKGEVTVAVEGLPAGASSTPVVLSEGSSGLISIAAAPDAQLGSFPIRVRASSVLNNEVVTRDAFADLNGKAVEAAYVTVLEAAPFTVAPVGTLPPDRINAFAGEISGLVTKLSSQSQPADDPKRLAWEKQIAAASPWSTLTYVQTGSAERGTFKQNDDGSLLARNGNRPTGMDTYNLVATTDLTGIAAIRLEVLTDDALPARGPGRSANGNFVLHEFKLTAAPKNEPTKAQPVPLKDARATFSQERYAVAGAIDGDLSTGWAISPETGKDQSAVFFTTTPVGFDGGTTFTIAMDQHFGRDHLIGKFRLSVTTDPKAVDAPPVPEEVREIVLSPREKRTPEQVAKLNDYYRAIDPSGAADRARLDVLRKVIAPYAEIARLEGVLQTQTPELDSAQKVWEKSIADGARWTPIDFATLKAASGSVLTKEADKSLFVSGSTPPQESFTLEAKTKLRGITAVRIEALPDPRLPANGPGRAGDGNFMLTGVRAGIGAVGVKDEVVAIEFASASASFEQKDRGIAGTLDDKADTGWAIGGRQGQPVTATFYAKSPAAMTEGEKRLIVTLEQQSPTAGQTLGRFRVYATTSASPDAAAAPLRSDIATLLRTPMDKRKDPEKKDLAEYYRSIAPSLDPIRARLAELRDTVPLFPVDVAKKDAGAIAVSIDRAKEFTGDVTVTLEGFQSGRDKDGPPSIGKSLKVSPLTLSTGATLGLLTFQVEQAAETGTKLAVLRAESKVGSETIVTYSPAFPVKVQ